MNNPVFDGIRKDGLLGSAFRLKVPIGLGLLDQMLISAAGLLITILVARSVSIAEFGAFSLAMTGILMISSLQNSLIVAPHAVLAAPLPDDQFREATTSALVGQFGLTCVSSLGMVALGAVSLLFSEQIMPVFLAAAIAAAFLQIQEFFRRVLYCKLDIRGALFNNILYFSILIPILVALALLGSLTGVRAVLAMAISALIAAAYGAVQTKSQITHVVDHRAMQRWWKRAWTLGKWLMGSSLLSWATTNLFPFLIAGFIGLGAVAALRTAQSLLGLTNVIFRFLDTTLLPRASSVLTNKGQAALNQFLTQIWWAIFPVFLAIDVFALLIGPRVITQVFGTDYRDDAWIVVPLAAGLLLTAASSVLGLGMKAMHQTDAQFLAYLLASVINLTGGVVLVKVFGLAGAVAGILISSAVVAAVMAVSFRREEQKRRLAQFHVGAS